MDNVGSDFNITGSVMSRKQLEDLRRKRGECITCGRKCYRKKLFKMVPITQDGEVLEGRCLQCQPLKENQSNARPPPRKATPQDLQRFARSQSNLSSRTGNALPSPATSTESRKNLLRAASSVTRIETRSTESLSNPSNTPRIMAGRKVASMLPLPIISGEDLSPPNPLPARPVASLNSTGGGESRPLSIPLQPSRVPAAPLAKLQSMPAIMTNGNRSRHRSDRNDPLETTSITSTSPGLISVATSTKSGISIANTTQPASFQHAPPKQSTSGDLPTHEELKQAALTILAAKQHGLYDDVLTTNSKASGDELQTTCDHMESTTDLHRTILDETPEDYEARVKSTSYRSLASIVSAEADGNHSNDLENDFTLPQHGLLDRGGAVQLNPSSTNIRRTYTVGEHTMSRGSMSSISSLEDEVQPYTVPSPHSYRRRELGNALEQHNTGRSGVSFRDLRYRGNSSGGLSSKTISENECLDKLKIAGQNHQEILVVLRDAMESALIVQAALEALAHIPLTGPNHDGLTQLGAHNIVTDAMRHHISSLPVQVWGCGAIWNMSGTERTQLAFVDIGSLDIILRAMDRFIDDVDLQTKAIAAIANLGAAVDNIATLMERGAIARIVDAMNKHSMAITIQMKGCTAVANMSSHDLPFKEQLMKNGAGGAVVVAMVMHPDDPNLQEKALRALRNLCANNDGNKFELALVGGIDAVIGAMQIHRDDASVQEEGAWTLSNLAGNDHNKVVIGDCGGVDVVIRAMWVHSDNVGVQEWCCRALFTLTLDSQNGDIVLEIGGISAIVNAMQAHVDSPTVQEMGCAVLTNLAGTDQSRMKIVDEEALDAIVLAMVLHTDNIQVQERACVFLLQLAILPNFKSMKAANIPELVRVAAEKFPDECQEPAGRLLRAFTTAY